MMERQRPAHTGKQNFLTSRAGIVMMGFLALGFVLLFTEHRAHVLGAVPFLLLLSCPLMHLFMHHGQFTRGTGSEAAREDREDQRLEDRSVIRVKRTIYENIVR